MPAHHPLWLIAILVPALATTLSSNNCPATFNITSANVTMSNSLQPLTDFLYGSIYSSSDQAQIQASFQSGNSTAISNSITYTPIVATFAVLAVCFAITFIIAICCCIFEKSCPPCKSWKRDFAIRPY